MLIHQMNPRLACSTLILGFYGNHLELPNGDVVETTLETFMSALIDALDQAGKPKTNEFYYLRECDDSRSSALVGHPWQHYGAVYAQTQPGQRKVISIFKQLGFTRCMEFYNEKNGTTVTAWMISMEDLVKHINEFKEKGK